MASKGDEVELCLSETPFLVPIGTLTFSQSYYAGDTSIALDSRHWQKRSV